MKNQMNFSKNQMNFSEENKEKSNEFQEKKLVILLISWFSRFSSVNSTARLSAFFLFSAVWCIYSAQSPRNSSNFPLNLPKNLNKTSYFFIDFSIHDKYTLLSPLKPYWVFWFSGLLFFI